MLTLGNQVIIYYKWMMINKTEGFLTSYHNQIIIGDTLITFSNRDWCHFHGTLGKKKVKRLGVVNELVIW